MLRCGDGSLYTGVTKDLHRRLLEHQEGKASRYTRSHQPVELVWSREVESWSSALLTERQIKRLARRDKESLVREASAARG
jgi:putative endonuclease